MMGGERPSRSIAPLRLPSGAANEAVGVSAGRTDAGERLRAQIAHVLV